MNKKIKLTFQWAMVIILSIYMMGSLAQNVLAIKSFGTPTFAVATAGTLISWLVFLAMDLITEIWGKKPAIRIFWLSAILNLIYAGIVWIAIVIPGTSPDYIDPQYATILGTSWRIALGSIVAFICGNYLNTGIMYIMRVRSKDKKKTGGFIARALISTFVGQFADNALFYLIAFSPLGISSVEHSWLFLLEMTACVTLIETLLEVLISPLTAYTAHKLQALKESEGIKTTADYENEKEALKWQEKTNN